MTSNLRVRVPLPVTILKLYLCVVELVYAPHLKCDDESHEGSTPSAETNLNRYVQLGGGLKGSHPLKSCE